jgi:hypothetical protein
MSVSRFTIKLIGFDEHETDCFLAVFDLAEFRLNHQWQIIRADNADFFLFLEEHLQAQVPDAPKSRCLFYSTQTLSARHILVNEGNVPSLRSMVEVFNRVGDLPSDEEPQELAKALGEVPELVTLPETVTVAQPEPTQKPEEPVQLAQVTQASTEEAADAIIEPASALTVSESTPEIAEQPISPEPLKTAAVSEEFADDRHVFYPNQGLLKALLAAKTDLTWIVINNEVDLWLDPIEGRFYSWADLEQFASFCTPTIQLTVKSISQTALQDNIAKHKLSANPLNNLIWYITFKASQGRLLEGNSPYDTVHLSGWPNLRLPEARNFIKLAAFMHSNTLPLVEIAKMTRTPLPQVFDFYNACHLIGLIEKGHAVKIHHKEIDPERHGLLQKIRDRLKL